MQQNLDLKIAAQFTKLCEPADMFHTTLLLRNRQTML
jgi:hypothetical protein